MQCLGLGIGLGILTYKVSDSESGLENRDSGNSAVNSKKLTHGRIVSENAGLLIVLKVVYFSIFGHHWFAPPVNHT